MKRDGQVILIVGFFLIVLLTLMAVVVDGGRLYLQQTSIHQGAQSAADAGIGVIADVIVTQAAAQQATAVANPCPLCTPTPDPEQAYLWLSDEDRQFLIASPQRTAVAHTARTYAGFNGFEVGHQDTIAVNVHFPFDYHVGDGIVRVEVEIIRQTTILLIGLLDRDFITLSSQAVSEIRQR